MNKTPHSFYTVRFSDCDLFGHLNNARYLDYFLNAREDHLKDHYQMELSTYYKQGISWLVGSHEINYLRPAQYNEKVCIQTSLVKASEYSLLVELQMLNEAQNELKAVMWTSFIPVNVKTGRRENHPIEFMDFAKSIVSENTFVEEGIKNRITSLIKEKKNVVSV